MQHAIYFGVTILAAVGLGALSAVIFAWRWVATSYQSWFVKVMAESARAVSAILAAVAVLVQFSGWSLAICLVVLAVSYLALVAASAIGDHKKQEDKESADDQIEILRLEIENLSELLNMHTTIISYIKKMYRRKKRDVLDSARNIPILSNTKNKAKDLVRDGLNPREQMQEAVIHLAQFLRDQLPNGEVKARQNFRVAFYVSEGGILKPQTSFDHLAQAKVFLKSYEQFPEFYRIDCTNRPACVVKCIQSGKAIIVEDWVVSQSYCGRIIGSVT